MEYTVVAIDAMGGDNAPGEIVKGAVEAVNNKTNIKVVLCGKEEAIQNELNKYNYDKERVSIKNATEVIETSEHPVNAIKKKKDSSMVVALNLVKAGEADAVVSAGNSGALMAGGLFIVGRIKGVERAPFAPLIPTAKGFSILVDAGANVDVRSSHLVQFAQMASIYMEDVAGKKNPTVGIVNCGAEEEKGNALVKETFPLLKECKGINFIGSVEPRDIPAGYCDVIVCDGFVGNAILKTYEGVASTLLKAVKTGLKSSIISKIGALLIMKPLKATLKDFDDTKYGGAPVLGLKGLVVKTHGSAKAVEVTNTIYQCEQFKAAKISEKIEAKIKSAEGVEA